MPYLALPHDARSSLLPALNRTVDLFGLSDFLHAFRDAPASGATAVVRAARMYQQGVWIADDNPNLAWLFLVSAAEVAAGYWKAETRPAEDVLREALPKVAQLCEAEGTEHLRAVANELFRLVGATKRFVDWMVHFCPPPPSARPPEWGQVDWSKLAASIPSLA